MTPIAAEAVGVRSCLPLDVAMTLDETERRILAGALRRNSDKPSLTAPLRGSIRAKPRFRLRGRGLETSD